MPRYYDDDEDDYAPSPRPSQALTRRPQTYEETYETYPEPERYISGINTNGVQIFSAVSRGGRRSQYDEQMDRTMDDFEARFLKKMSRKGKWGRQILEEDSEDGMEGLGRRMGRASLGPPAGRRTPRPMGQQMHQQPMGPPQGQPGYPPQGRPQPRPQPQPYGQPAGYPPQPPMGPPRPGPGRAQPMYPQQRPMGPPGHGPPQQPGYPPGPPRGRPAPGPGQGQGPQGYYPPGGHLPQPKGYPSQAQGYDQGPPGGYGGY